MPVQRTSVGSPFFTASLWISARCRAAAPRTAVENPSAPPDTWTWRRPQQIAAICLFIEGRKTASTWIYAYPSRLSDWEHLYNVIAQRCRKLTLQKQLCVWAHAVVSEAKACASAPTVCTANAANPSSAPGFISSLWQLEPSPVLLSTTSSQKQRLNYSNSVKLFVFDKKASLLLRKQLFV